ncbi:MAG: S8 family serine peptidase [Planctomycetes bacterium]|nr:S8 family serine peptidase [Planctomycetota bacterium]
MIKRIKIFLPLAILLLAFTLNIANAEKEIEQDKYTLEVKDSLINLQADNVSFKEILRELERKTGIKINIYESVEDRKVSLNIKNLPSYALSTLLEEMSLKNSAVVYDQQLAAKVIYILPQGQDIAKVIKGKSVISPAGFSDGKNVNLIKGNEITTITKSENNVPIRYVKDELLLKFRHGVTEEEIKEILIRHDLILVDDKSLLKISYIKVRTAGRDVTEVIEEISKEDKVQVSEPNYIAEIMAVADPLYDNQWYIPDTNFDKAWDTAESKNKVKIAVIDTGVNANHPDLTGRVLEGYDFVNGRPDSVDDNGHGTFVTGIISAAANDIGIKGLYDYAQIIPVKVMDKNGLGIYEDVARGVIYAADNGAEVINLSLGGYAYSSVLQEAVDYALSKDCIVVAAGGNDGIEQAVYPAANSGVIGVSALGYNGQIWIGSNSGTHIDVSAPGVDILSTGLNSDYVYAAGTSSSTPMVSALAGMLVSENPDLSSLSIVDLIIQFAKDLGDKGRDNVYGSGEIDASASLKQESESSQDTGSVSDNGNASPPQDINAADDDSKGLEYAPGEIIIKFRSEAAGMMSLSETVNCFAPTSISSIDTLNKKFKVRKLKKLFQGKKKGKTLSPMNLQDLSGVYKVELPEDVSIFHAIYEYGKDQNIEYAELNYNVKATITYPNDSSFAQQWSLNNTGQTGGTNDADIDTPEAWDITTGSSNVTIAVVDTGVDPTHTDLSANIWQNGGEIAGNGIDDDGNGFIDDVNGWDFNSNDNDPVDDHNHGTHVSGICSAVSNDSAGIAGVSWNSKIMPLKVLNYRGGGLASNVAKGIVYAADNGAHVINLSLGGSHNSLTMKIAIDYAHAQNCVIVAASGNSGSNDLHYPAAYDNTISVAATDHNDQQATFSTYGQTIDVAAPGVSIYSTIRDNNYESFNGTSMAAPHVSGIAALCFAMKPISANREVIKAIYVSAEDISTQGWDQYTGFGRVNAYHALVSDAISYLFARIRNPLAGSIIISKSVTITGTAAGRNFSHYEILIGRGSSPSSWETTGITITGGEVVDGVLGTWDCSNVESDTWTIKLISYDNSGTTRENTSYVAVDNSYPAGWPQVTLHGDSAHSNASIVAGDIDNDGYPEVVTGSFEGILYVWRYDGTVMKGWPKYVGSQSNTPALADLDNDGDLEIVISGGDVYLEERLSIFHHDGRPFEGSWPKIRGNQMNGVNRATVIADIDGDGDLEILAANELRQICAWHHDGSKVSGWPVTLYNNQSGTAVAVGDIDADGDMEIVAAEGGTSSVDGITGNVYVWNANGTTKSGWPVNVEGTFYQPVLGDVNGDGTLEVIISSRKGLSVFDVQGNLLFFRNIGIQKGRKPCLGDLNNDGIPEIILPTGAEYNGSINGYLYAWYGDGSEVQGWPLDLGFRRSTYGAVVGDVDGDGNKEVICGVYDFASTTYLYVINHDGTFTNGFPQQKDISDFSVPVLADIDMDGDVEIIAHGRRILGKPRTKVNVWDLPGEYNEDLIDWAMIGRNAQHTASFEVLDSDSDGIFDLWEITNFGNLITANATTDYDNDGLLDKDEYANSTDPKNNDSDGDGIDDSTEVNTGTNPNCADNDNDGYGVGAGCSGPDCNDNDPGINPGVTEICENGIDDDCDGQDSIVVTLYMDSDGDGYGNPVVSTDACIQPSGYVTDDTDCHDNNRDINPGATEVCDGVDNNCNGQIDEGLLTTYYEDSDGDGYGDPAASTDACTQPQGYVTDGTDCDDTDPGINPGATDICNNGIDEDCNGQDDTCQNYNATGTWIITLTDTWVDIGNAGCSSLIDDGESEIFVLNQTENGITMVDSDGISYQANVNGLTYTFTASQSEDGITVTVTIIITFRSRTSGAGTFTWSMVYGKYHCNGGATVSATNQPGMPLWEYNMGDHIETSPAIGYDGTIYVGSGDKFYALNPDGTRKWQYYTGFRKIFSTPVIGDDGTIYVGSGGDLDALNPDGTRKWRFTKVHSSSSSPAISADGTIYVGSSDGLNALNPDGTKKWEFTEHISSSPTIGSDGTIYAGGFHKLYAINPDGTKKWEFAEVGYYSLTIVAEGTIYVGSGYNVYTGLGDNKLYALNLDGTKKWEFPTVTPVHSSPAIGTDGTIYVMSYDERLYAINPDGTKKWEFIMGGYGSSSSPAIGADGTIYVGSSDNKFYAINPDGTKKWEFLTGDHINSSPAIGTDGTIFVGSRDNKFYAIYSDSGGLANSPWPMFRNNIRHTGNPDTDNDGISDFWEITNFENLITADETTDYDNDGLLDKDEYANKTDPTDTDSDDDDLLDYDEIMIHGIDPNNPDTDGDGMPDGWEVTYGLDPLVDDSAGDTDGDGLTNLDEYTYNTDPKNPDSYTDENEDKAYEHLYKVMDKFHNSFDVYTNQDEGGNHFSPSGWMGDISSISFDSNWASDCYSGTSCIKIAFSSTGNNWAGLYWQEPENNWGAVPNAGYNITGATKVTFYAKGENGGERVEFFVGGITGAYPDSLPKTSTGYITLTSSWQKYTIDLTSVDLSSVIGGFGWVTDSSNNPSGATFYLDDIKYDKSRPNDLRFLVSFETLPFIDPDRYIKNSSFVYDNALALLTFLARGNNDDLRRAKLLADAFIYAQNNDRFYTDGRLRNAYMSGDLIDYLTGKVRIPGWWDPVEERWYEDQFQASTHTGNLAWTMIALTSYYEKIGGSQYLTATETLGEWIEMETRDTRGAGGYTGGYDGWEPTPQKITWKSTEHNIDVYVAFMRIYGITGDKKWEERALHAKNFIDTMWNAAGNHFWTGTLEDGITTNTNNIPLDIQAWALMALYSYNSALGWAGDNCFTEHHGFKGFDFNNDNDGVWFEGTAQMAVAYQINEENSKSDFYITELRKAQAFANNTNAKGIVAACHDGVTTGFDWEYFSRLHIGATAWYIFSEIGYNPYWATPIDTDVDGISNSWEIDNFGDLTTADNTTDYDNDGLLDKYEYANNTDPKNNDNDGDGMPDGWEVTYGLDPLVDDSAGDIDGDGLTNKEEFYNGTDPINNSSSSAASVTWTELVGVTVNGNSIIKHASNGWGNSGAASLKSFTDDGCAVFTVSQTSTNAMFGLSSTNRNAIYKTIEYAIYLRIKNGINHIHIYEVGARRGGPSGFGSYQNGDHLRTEEACDGEDNNCNDQIDESIKTTYYEDLDRDGFGNPAVSTDVCTQLPDYVTDNTDCDDSDSGINPGTTEICENGIDEDYNGQDDTCIPSDASGMWSYSLTSGWADPGCEEKVNEGILDIIQTGTSVTLIDCDGT